MSWCNCSRLLLVFSLVFLSHAASVTRQDSIVGDHRDLESQIALVEDDIGESRGEDSQPSSSNSRLDALLQTLDPPPNCTSTGNQTHHDSKLECFLWNLKVNIPEQSFEKAYITLSVHDMVCTNFRLHGLRSNSSSLADGKERSELFLSVQTESATCQGRYHVTGGVAGNVVATVGHSAKDSKALELRVGVNNNKNSTANVRLPYSFETLECGTFLGCEDIRFSGSISAKMIQAFSGKIGGHITKALQEQICPLMTKAVDPIVTQYLKEFDDLIRPFLESAPEVVTNSSAFATHSLHEAPGATNLVDFPAVHSTLSFLNEQLRDHLQIGWIPLPPPSFHRAGGSPNHIHKMSQKCIDSFRGISGWIVTTLGRRPRFPLPQNLRHLVFPIPEEIGANGTIALDIPEVVVEGLDEMDALQVLAPSPASKDLDTRLASRKGFSVVLPIDLEIRWPVLEEKDADISGSPTLRESFRLMINVTQIDATLSSLIEVVDWDSMSLLQVVEAGERFMKSQNLLDLACLFRTLHTVQLSKDGSFVVHDLLIDAIRLSRDTKDVPEGSLEADLDDTINTIVDLFLVDYSNLWTELVRGLVRGPGSRELNRYIEDWLRRYSTDDGCPATTSFPGRWVNFTQFDFLNTFNRYLDHSHTVDSVNDFILCLAESIEEVVDGDGNSTRYRIADRDGVGGAIATSVFPDEAATSSKLDLPSSVSEIFNEGTDLFLESGNTISIRDESTEITVALSTMELRNWDSVERMQIIKPSSDNSLASSLTFGTTASLEDVQDGRTASPWVVSNAVNGSVATSMGPPEIEVVVNVGGNFISGQINLTLFGSLDANADVSIDYDLNRLENLTMSHLLEQVECALIPAMQIRLLPWTTNLAFGEYFGANLTADINGKNFSLSTEDFPRFSDVSDDALSWFEEFARTSVNYAIEEWIKVSSRNCPGVVVPEGDKGDENDHGGIPVYWMWRDSTTLWIILGLFVVLQGGFVFVNRSPQRDGDINEVMQANDSVDVADTSRTTPLLSSYEELMSHPSSETIERNPEVKPNNSIDDLIIRDMCEEWDEEDEPQGILEDQLVEEWQEKPKISIFKSDKIPEYMKYLVPIMVIGTIALFLGSNLSIGASVDVSVQLGQRAIGIPGVFQFSLGSTVSEMYQAGIYPLLILVLCFSGLWPYVKLLAMFFYWMKPSADQHQRERRLLTLDAMGKYSLVDNYVLILFVVAFRFHLALSDNLGIDVYVTPVFGFFSFLFATCLSLMLGHAVLFFHRKTMQNHSEDCDSLAKTSLLNHGFKVQNEDSNKRFSRIVQGLLLLFVLSTMGMLLWGFLQESYTFEIGGLAGMMLGEDVSRTSYSVLSLGAALPSSVENPESLSIVFLQATFFFFTVVTPILCLLLILVLMVMPLTLKWQQYLLVAAEIANSWSAVEVFLLSIIAALFQISTFASFMIGDKCDEINIVAKAIFGDEDSDAVCFTVDASVESNCWYLLVGALANFSMVSICLGFAEIAVEEKVEDSCSGGDPLSSSEALPHPDSRSPTFIQKLQGIPCLGCILFASVPRSHSLWEEAFSPMEFELDGTEDD